MHSTLAPLAQGLLRIVAGAAWFTHGGQKIFGWFGASSTVELLSLRGTAGVIELVGGTLLVLGLFTRPVAFIASGQMAVAYFYVHVMGGGLWWWNNRGELAMVFCFLWLFFAAAGAGAWSVDGRLRDRELKGSADRTP
jgi:putative oxidoreductase